MTQEITEVAGDVIEGPPRDIIGIEREIGRSRASVTLMSGVTVTGDWAAGDSQAFRRLITALVEVADVATAQAARSTRLIQDLSAGTRLLRGQLRNADDDITRLQAEKEEVQTRANNRVGELVAEVTRLTAEVGRLSGAPTVTPQVAALTRERDKLQAALVIEKRRADIAAAQARSMVGYVDAGAAKIRLKAIDAARAADQAFEEAKWKEGGRYLKLANMWTNLLNVVPPSREPEPS